MTSIVIKGIRAYKKVITPYILRSCRFEPTCSDYAITAIERKGIVKGAILSMWRIVRCNPFSRGGWDPVEPDQMEK